MTELKDIMCAYKIAKELYHNGLYKNEFGKQLFVLRELPYTLSKQQWNMVARKIAKHERVFSVDYYHDDYLGECIEINYYYVKELVR